jgi:hypothetical protein
LVDQVVWVYEHTEEGSPLRRLVVDYRADVGREGLGKQVLEGWTKECLIDLVGVLVEERVKRGKRRERDIRRFFVELHD